MAKKGKQQKTDRQAKIDAIRGQQRSEEKRRGLMIVGVCTAVALLIRWRLRSSIGLLIWLAAFGVTAADDVREVVTAPKWLAGLIRVSPFVVFGMLPFAAGRRASLEGQERWLPAIVLVTEGFSREARDTRRDRERRMPDVQGLVRAASRHNIAIYGFNPADRTSADDRHRRIDARPGDFRPGVDRARTSASIRPVRETPAMPPSRPPRRRHP